MSKNGKKMQAEGLDNPEGAILALIKCIIKFLYNERSDWLKQRALLKYTCTE